MNSTIKTICIIALLLGPIFQVKAEDEKIVKSAIKEVTVFLSGAQVTRTSKVTLLPGTNMLKIENLSADVNPNSIQVKGNKKFTILSVNHQINYLKGAATTEEIEIVKDSLDDFKFQLDMERSMKNVYSEEKNMLLANRVIRGNEAGVIVEDLKEMANYYRERLREIQYKLLEIERKEKDLNKEIARLKQQLSALNYQTAKPTSEIIISVKADDRITTDLDVSFVVSSASWTPVYDVRSDDVDGPVQLTYKAKVLQNTGNDWEDVKIKLSTGNPTQSSTMPDLNPWVLDLGQPVALYAVREISNKRLEFKGAEEKTPAVRDDVSGGARMEDGLWADGSTTLAGFTNMSQSSVNTEFDIKVPYSIYSDGKHYDVEIQKHNVPAQYNYYAAPKFDNDAFLLARLVSWDELNLLSGTANIYFQGTFVGTSYIDTHTTNDTLDISMGRDKSIVVQRTKVKDFTKRQTIGSSKKITLGMELTLRNTKNKTVVVNLEDQIPVSNRKEIEVEALETSDANYNEETGKLEWHVILGPGETKKFVFKYQVKYPKNMAIKNL